MHSRLLQFPSKQTNIITNVGNSFRAGHCTQLAKNPSFLISSYRAVSPIHNTPAQPSTSIHSFNQTPIRSSRKHTNPREIHPVIRIPLVTLQLFPLRGKTTMYVAYQKGRTIEDPEGGRQQFNKEWELKKMFTCFLRISSRTRTRTQRPTAGTVAGCAVARRPFVRDPRTGRPGTRTTCDSGGGCHCPSLTRRWSGGGHRVSGPQSAWAAWMRSHGPFL